MEKLTVGQNRSTLLLVANTVVSGSTHPGATTGCRSHPRRFVPFGRHRSRGSRRVSLESDGPRTRVLSFLAGIARIIGNHPKTGSDRCRETGSGSRLSHPHTDPGRTAHRSIPLGNRMWFRPPVLTPFSLLRFCTLRATQQGQLSRYIDFKTVNRTHF